MRNPFTVVHKPLSSKKKGVLVGAYVPQEIAHYLALYAIYCGTAKSPVIQDLLQKAIDKLPTTEQLIDRLSMRALSEWNQRIRENLGKPGWRTAIHEDSQREKYCLELRQILRKRVISQEHIDKILTPLLEKEK